MKRLQLMCIGAPALNFLFGQLFDKPAMVEEGYEAHFLIFGGVDEIVDGCKIVSHIIDYKQVFISNQYRNEYHK